MKYSKSKPFTSWFAYWTFREEWCDACIYYKERRGGSLGYPEFPERGGCIILDEMDSARFDSRRFPVKDIIEERDEDGNVMYSHKCTKYEEKKVTNE